MKQLINNICETGKWSKVCNKFKIIDFKEKQKPTNYLDIRTICFIANTAKIVGRILKRKIERKIEDVFRLDNFEFRRGQISTNATGTLAIRINC